MGHIHLSQNLLFSLEIALYQIKEKLSEKVFFKLSVSYLTVTVIDIMEFPPSRSLKYA